MFLKLALGDAILNFLNAPTGINVTQNNISFDVGALMGGRIVTSASLKEEGCLSILHVIPVSFRESFTVVKFTGSRRFCHEVKGRFYPS